MRFTATAALLLLTQLMITCRASSLWVDRYAVSFTSPANATDAEPASWSGMPLGDGDLVSLTSVAGTGKTAARGTSAITLARTEPPSNRDGA